MDEQQEREQRGLVIAAKSKLQQSGDGRWFVPSQTGHRGTYYTVKPDPAKPHCSCPDFECRQLRCKHIFAVEYVIQREFTYDEQTQTETVTETVTVKKTYKQEWTAYNRAQSHEKERFLSLLAELCKQSYDTRVAGVISEQPGIALGESGAGKVLVATTGRVLVDVDATNGPIHIGDLLVTGDVPGVAMKSEPVKVGGRLMHMPGTLIGKALEPMEKGSGKILVLLSLQ